MKAILVIDMPKVCDKCPLIDGNRCIVTREEIEDPWGEIEKSCPLKSMPHKKELEITSVMSLVDHVSSLNQYKCGYNDCIDEILGEEE